MEFSPSNQFFHQLKHQNLTSPEFWNSVLIDYFKYSFDSSRCLKDVNTGIFNSGAGYEFQDQESYDNLGYVIVEYIQSVMINQYSMKEVRIPNHDSPCNIFHSQDWTKNKQKALIIIQGAGEVRAGQWARSVCINDSLDKGSVFKFLDFAKEEGYSVIVMNPNFIQNPTDLKRIKDLETPEKHCNFVWKHFIKKCAAKKLFILAHSCGGVRTIDLLHNHTEDFSKRVKAIALTDSVHMSVSSLSPSARSLFSRLAVNWVKSPEALDTPVRSSKLSRK